jgi:hypothetical protein
MYGRIRQGFVEKKEKDTFEKAHMSKEKRVESARQKKEKKQREQKNQGITSPPF